MEAGSRDEWTVKRVYLSAVTYCKAHISAGAEGVLSLFPAQEELGRTISQLLHAFQTTEAREYPRHGRVGPEWPGLGRPAHPGRLGLRSGAGEGPIAGVCGARVWGANTRSLIYPEHTRLRSLKG